MDHSGDDSAHCSKLEYNNDNKKDQNSDDNKCLSTDKSSEINAMENVKNDERDEHIQKFSTIPPLPTSTTTAMTLRFISTTINFMNSFAASADEKLEKCGKRIRDLDVKVSLLESKLDSIDELEKKEVN